MSDVTGTWPGRFVTFGGMILTFLFFYLWVAYVDENSSALKDYQLALMVALGAGLSLFIFGLVINFLWMIPWELWNENQLAIDEMSERLRPQLTLKKIGPQSLRKLEFGHVNFTLTGRRYITINRWSSGVVLPVENPGAMTLTGCRAYLAQFAPLGETNDNWESLSLPWVPTEENCQTVDIPSGGTRGIWVLNLINNMPSFILSAAPIDMVQSIQPKGEYRGLIVLTAHEVAASHIPFTLLCDGPENPPVLTLMELEHPHG